jgi:hypothetical protein
MRYPISKFYGFEQPFINRGPRGWGGAAKQISHKHWPSCGLHPFAEKQRPEGKWQLSYQGIC